MDCKYAHPHNRNNSTLYDSHVSNTKTKIIHRDNNHENIKSHAYWSELCVHIWHFVTIAVELITCVDLYHHLSRVRTLSFALRGIAGKHPQSTHSRTHAWHTHARDTHSRTHNKCARHTCTHMHSRTHAKEFTHTHTHTPTYIEGKSNITLYQ